MKILSIDVGMKNLAYCLFEYDPSAGEIKTPELISTDHESMMQLVNIMAWDTVNLCDTAEPAASKAPTCTHPECKFSAKFAHSSALRYCTRHANASGYKMPLQPSITSSKSLKKMTLEQLRAFSGEYLSSPIPEKCENSKMKLVQHLTAAIADEYLVAVTTKPKVISAASVDLITIGRNMHRRFDALPHLVSGIDVVIIENQLSTLATRMKTLQGMITQYFIMRGVPDIRFISATNKLKLFDPKKGGEETGYADRKKRGIEITRALIAAHAPALMSVKFEQHKKKDDLADCFLQGVWWLGTCRP
jgi:Mitochondrial resolvase Ydc2 / RNA splicing MRS1